MSIDINELQVWYWTNRHSFPSWMGVPCFKYTTDLWMYQELIFTIQPDFIIECGVAQGGTTLFLANILDLIGHGQVIGIDTNAHLTKKHPRISLIEGIPSIAPECIKKVKEIIGNVKYKKIIVILDSDHHAPYVIREIEVYKDFVSLQSYLIVEDTFADGILKQEMFKESGGPMKAVNEFLSKNKDFVIDKSCERFYLTVSPNGYLKRVK